MVLGVVVVVEWLLMAIGAGIFLAVLGRPWRSRDPQMTWHVATATAVAGAQPVALLLAGLSMWPVVMIEGLAMAMVWWRLVLLIQTRRRARRRTSS